MERREVAFGVPVCLGRPADEAAELIKHRDDVIEAAELAADQQNV